MHKAIHVGLSLLLVSSSFAATTSARPADANAKAADAIVATEHEHAAVGLPNIDIRRDPETNVINGLNLVAAKAAPMDRSAALDTLKARVPASNLDSIWVDVHDSGIPKTITNFEGVLTDARAGSPDDIARDYLTENGDVFGLSRREVRNLELTVNDLDQTTGITYLKFQQMV